MNFSQKIKDWLAKWQLEKESNPNSYTNKPSKLELSDEEAEAFASRIKLNAKRHREHRSK